MDNEIGFISSLIGDPVRLKIMWALMDGRAFTATELAMSADTSPQNVSMHLAKLVQGEFLTVESQGRHRYYRFARVEVAAASILAKKNTLVDLAPFLAAVPAGQEGWRA